MEVRFYGKAVKVIESGDYHPSERVKKLKDGSVIYNAKVKGTDEILRWILGFGEEAEVLKPEELREEVKFIAVRLNNLYQKTP